MKAIGNMVKNRLSARCDDANFRKLRSLIAFNNSAAKKGKIQSVHVIKDIGDISNKRLRI